MARLFQQVAPGRLQIREGGGLIALFGLPFLAAGLFAILTGLGVVPVAGAGAMPGFAWLVVAVLGLVSALVGVALVFGRSWTTIDVTEHTIIKAWGLLWPMHVQTHPLQDYTAVTLRFTVGDSDKGNQFLVGLKFRDGPDLYLCSSTEYAESRACAAAVAQHLRLAIEDYSTEHPTYLSTGQADLPLVTRLRLEHREERRSERPSAARSKVSETNGAVRIIIPMPRASSFAPLAMLIPVAIPLVVVGPLARFFRQSQTPEPVAWIFLGFLILMFGILPASAAINGFLRSRLGRTIVTLSTEGIRIEERGVWRTNTIASLSAFEILDVDYSASRSMIGSGQSSSGSYGVGERVLAALSRLARGRAVTIKSRRGLTTFGHGLEDEEIHYLHSIVRHTLAAFRPPDR